MKVIGKNPKMFIGDKEIGTCTSFSINTDVELPEELLVPNETVKFFEGVYDPPDGKTLESLFPKLSEIDDEFIGTITSPSGEKRDALLRIKYEAGIVSIEPVDENVKQWVKGWLWNTVVPIVGDGK